MRLAHENPFVQTASRAFLRAPVRGMVMVLRRSLYNKFEKRYFFSIVNNAGLLNAYHEDAFEMIDATNAIYDMEAGSRAYARGALIEQIAEGLLSIRQPGLLTEQCIGPLDGDYWEDGRSDPIDFYVPESPQEFWDAKSDVSKIESKHVNQFNQLLRMADYNSMAGFITLEDRIEVVESLAGIQGFDQPLYAYAYENFETMAGERPLTRVDPNA